MDKDNDNWWATIWFILLWVVIIYATFQNKSLEDCTSTKNYLINKMPPSILRNM